MDRALFLERLGKVIPKNEIERAELIHRLVNDNVEEVNSTNHEMLIAVEELSELQKELVKGLRKKPDRVAILEEYADVAICMMCIKEVYKLSNTEINDAIDVKMDRIETHLDSDEVYL